MDQLDLLKKKKIQEVSENAKGIYGGFTFPSQSVNRAWDT